MQSYKLVLAMSNLFEHWLKFQSEIVATKRAGRQHTPTTRNDLFSKKFI